MSERSERAGRKRTRRIAQIVVSVALVIGIFAFAIPKLADYSTVWIAITHMYLIWRTKKSWLKPVPR